MLVGLDVSTSAAPDADPVADARLAEKLGFDFVSASDHPAGAHPTNETWTMLAFLAARTERIRVLSRVLAVPFRGPAMVAKMSETLDRLSGGRLILGLGAGHADSEFRALGLPVRTPREKIDALGEALTLIEALWREPVVDFVGRYTVAEHAELTPKPSRPIPVWLGTFGPRGLALTGRLADGWIPSLGYLPREELADRRRAVLAGAEAAGRPPEAVTCALNVAVHVGEEDGDPEAVAGSPDAICADLAGIAGLGFSAFNLVPTGRSRDEQVARLGEEVLPLMRQI